MIALGDLHRFEAAGQPFVYLAPSGAVFGLDETATAVLGLLADGPRSRESLSDALTSTHPAALVDETVGELLQLRALVAREPLSASLPQAAIAARVPDAATIQKRVIPLVPLQTLVLNVTNQCNLACAYCYEYGEDRIPGSTAHGKDAPEAANLSVKSSGGKMIALQSERAAPPPTATRGSKFMSRETARESVELALRESGASPVFNLTFFGGETLLNFPVLRETITYARERAAAVGKRVEFSLTTNATLLRPDIIEFLADENIGVTISIDGPRELQDKFRVFHNGTGSYDIVVPKIRALLQRHRSRPIGARVTLTAQVNDVQRIFRHLTEDIGFHEVGFAPVTSSLGREWAMSETGLDAMLAQFEALADEWLQHALAGRHHAFSNITETLEEIHQGASKAYPCGAGFGLMGVSTDGDVSLCHRFAGSDEHKLGSVRDGIDREAQAEFLGRHHVDHKVDCASCWARPLCAGGCYHEAYTRHGDTAAPNLHFCDWIRGWTSICLRVYGELATRNPAFLTRFDRAEAPMPTPAAQAAAGRPSPQVSYEAPHVN
jgi:uncharacterized protein